MAHLFGCRSAATGYRSIRGLLSNAKIWRYPHTPLHCLVGAGFIPIVREVVELKGPHGLFPVNRWIAANGDQRNLVLYSFQARTAARQRASIPQSTI